MRANIDIDDGLMARALSFTGIATKREVVETELREMADRRERVERQRRAIDELWGSSPDWGADLPDDDPLKPKPKQ